jgi:hypothetical protein
MTYSYLINLLYFTYVVRLSGLDARSRGVDDGREDEVGGLEAVRGGGFARRPLPWKACQVSGLMALPPLPNLMAIPTR